MGGTRKRFVAARWDQRMAGGPPVPGAVVTLLAVGGALLVAGGLGSVLPTVDRRTVLAAVPWVLAAALVHALALAGAYDGPLAGLLGTPLVVPAAVVVAGVAWLLLVGFGRLRGRADPAAYLAATGAGALVPLLLATALYGRATVATLVPVVVAPAAAGVAAGAVLLVLGLAAAPSLAATRSLALLVVYGQAFHAVAVLVAVDALGAPAGGPLARVAVRAGADLPVVDVLGTSWPYAVVKLCVGALVVVAAARFVDRNATATYVGLGAVAALGLGLGVTTLFGATLLA
jgi:uncharacterized membrane protein